jgi:hypothetical protein
MVITHQQAERAFASYDYRTTREHRMCGSVPWRFRVDPSVADLAEPEKQGDVIPG